MKCVVGIDLGTTNSVVAYVPIEEENAPINVLAIAQLTAPGTIEERPLLPSVAAYLDRKAASTLLADAGAREPVFPASDEDRMLPTQIAYFEALEARRIAAAEAELREAQMREAQLRQAQQAAAAPVPAPATLSADVPAEVPAEGNIDRVAENVRQ